MVVYPSSRQLAKQGAGVICLPIHSCRFAEKYFMEAFNILETSGDIFAMKNLAKLYALHNRLVMCIRSL